MSTETGPLVAELRARARACFDEEANWEAPTCGHIYNLVADMIEPVEQRWQADRARWQAQTEALKALEALMRADETQDTGPIVNMIADRIEAILQASQPPQEGK